MRERTPSADDTPKRAPPAPSREAAVAGSETPNDDTIEAYHTAKLATISDSISDATSSSDRMVASMQSLEDLAVNHSANATGSNGDRQQQQQERYGHAYKSAQTAQDKRSRLSNVINNLRKKVPDGTAKGNAESARKEEDDRNSVERNLETLEKYVMTVLNGVIKDNEEEDKGKSVENTKEPERRRKDADDDENPTGTKSESSNEGDIEAAAVPCLEDSSKIGNAESSKMADCSNTKGAMEESIEVSEVKLNQDSKELSSRTEEEHLDIEKEESLENDRDISREKKENRTLGTIIMDRLSEHQVEERANVDDGRGEDRRDEHVISENMEVRAICTELLDELLNDVHLTIDNQKSQQRVEECEKIKEVSDTAESKVEDIKDSNLKVQESTTKSLHCSLPLDKVASVLQNCQTSESMASRLSSGSPLNAPSTQKSKSSSSTSPPVRLLCLYCDRKFSSISLRQRHTERVHQLGGRRSERNSRKPSQNCQYCSEKCADTLEMLFQHMISNHGDKYHACIQCLTRYPTREALTGHVNETHSGNTERSTSQVQEKIKEGSPCKEFYNREKVNVPSVKERISEEKELETSQGDSRQLDSTRTKLIATRDSIDNPASPEFDSSFYSNVSCNIRENLLHHLDGKLQTIGGSSACSSSITVSSTTTTMMTELKSQQQQQPPQQSYYEHSVNQVQFQSPIDISLTAATPVYSKDYSAGEEYENSSEYARKAGKTSSGSRPRRVSFEKYNFPRKYDGREQWTCSIKDLNKFDISTQLSLRKKQQLIKERLTINRLHQIPLMSCETTEVSLRDGEHVESVVEPAASNQDNVDGGCSVDAASAILDVVSCDPGESLLSEIKKETTEELSAATLSSRSTKSFITTEFTIEFADFMRLNRREQSGNEANIEKIIYAELSGEWSRTRIYICGACGSKHMTLKEMEDHKASTHPRVLCSHFELTGDQREHYTHLYLPGQNKPTDEARDATLEETVCSKCTKSCLNVAELHRHMLECGGDHAWLLGLTGSGKRKCKWRPFGSRSRRRRQRGMKRNIQNSQTQPRIVNAEQRPKEKQTPTGPRVRPSDRKKFSTSRLDTGKCESIQKMLANLPAKRATRKVLQDNAMRSQGKLRNVQTRTRPRIIGDNSSVSRISRNKAALRNKLLKNAKSIQRNRCRSDNITAVIESVVKKCHETEKRSDGDGKNVEVGDENKKDAKEINEVFLASKTLDLNVKVVRPKAVGRPRIFDKKAKIDMKRKIGNSQFQGKDDKLANLKAKGKSGKFKSTGTSSETKSDVKGEETSSPKNTPKNSKTTSRTTNKGTIGPGKKRISVLGIRNKKKTMQGVLKRKRSADPMTSYLKASLKAKSQLRTQDGKFARNPNKEAPTKSLELKMDDGKHKTVSSVESKLLKPKAIQKLKKAKVKLPRRVTRLSSDSDKMPTLEPAMQIVSPNEDDADKSTNDLPILSPVTSSGSLQDQKTLRTSAKHVSKEKESNTETNTEVAPEKSTKEQKSTRGRKPKQEPKNTAKRKEEIIEENEISKNNSMMLKERKKKIRKTLHTKNINNGENSKEETSKGEVNVKKDSKSKKEETKETRSNSKSKIEKDSMKLPDIPFEVKKLLGSASKEDLLNTLEIASNDTGSKRSLRQSTPRSKPLQANDKSPRELDEELDNSKGAGKKEKVEAIRKSSRKNVEKKDDEKMVKTINLEKDIKDATNNVTQNERNQQSKKETRANAKSKEIDSTDIEDKIDSRQTRRSLIEARSEPSSEVTSSSSQKASGLSGKRRSRIKSIDEETNTHATQKQNNSENVIPSEKETQKKQEFEETIDKNETEGDNNNCDNRDSMMMNLNLSHLQSETSNLSVDSGKENSLETSVNVHNKLKVTKPKKTWGARRERSSRKRSLNNVIGILTEGINIPVEQSVQVLTVQTSLDNPERVTRNGNTQQPVGEDNVTTVLARNEQESTENEVVATNVNDHHADDEKNARPCIDKTQDENAFADQTDTSSKVSTAKVNSPTNDIILDLSRRKSKGKGSYLEKIVSKIAKQKDALLEGEVGSLLDNAADELTSILDEVGPALADNTECTNFGEVSYASKNENNESTIITSTSSNKKSPIIAISENRSENDAIIKNATAERSTDLMIQDNREENLATRIEIKSKNQTKVNDVSDAETKDNYVVDRQVSDTMRSVEESQVESCENKSATNEEAIIPMEIPDETPSSLTDTLTEISISSITTQKLNVEKLEKKESGVKSRRKSSKRSLEDASWSKKSKRKSLEVVEDFNEKDIQKEFRLDDIIASIPKQKEMFNVRHELEKEDKTMKISEIDAKVEKFQHSESKDLELSSLEKILAEDDESNLERFANLPEAAYEEAAELTSNLEEAVNKIISDEEVVEANTEAIELIEENIESSTLKKAVKSEKSKDRTRKKNQTSESVRRTSKRKSQSLSSVLQTSVKPINELLSSSRKEDSLEFTDEIKIEITNENDILEKSLYTIETTSKKRDEIQIADNLTSSKITRKQATKKKSLADEHLTLPEDEPAEVTSKFNEGPNVADSIEQLSASLEPFKIPEVKDLLQSVKKRGPKKKVLLEDDRCNGKTVSEESWINEELAEVNEMSNLIEKVEEQIEFKEHIQEQLITKTLERSSSSGSIGLTPSVVKTRSMFKKTQLSSEEDLAVASIRSQDAESTDDLSESSCASESSYFRRKRFAKRKRKEENVAHDNEEADLITLNSDKENLNEETAKVKSLLDEHLDLSDVDDLDIPIDIEASLENTKALESIEREFELAEKSAALQNEADTPVDDTPVNDAPVNDAPVNDESVNDAPINDAPVNDASVNDAPVNDAPVNDAPVNDTPSTNKSSNKDATTEQTIASNLDSLDDALAPKKRTAGNFVVVHTKTGEILIVEKRKKLTKEAAKFYCDVCATSFTRNSSLKKHTQSQSHLQMKSTKDKLEPANNSTQSDNVKETDKEKSDQVSDRNAKGVSNDGQAYEIIPKTSNESYTPYVVVTESLDLGVMKQETLEDKLLDEEICKITENMSHEEYVLTDQVTPEEPISSSTPKQIQKKQDESEQNRSGDKKRNKKKKNLAEEHLLLDSPDLEEFKFDPNELASNTVNCLVQNSSSPSYEHSSTKEIVQTEKETKDVPEEIHFMDSAETKKEMDSIVESLNDEVDYSKLLCDTEMKDKQHIESTRTTRSTLKKVGKVDNDKKEESETSSETTRFSLRPRRNKNIQHYEESDVEADIYFIDVSMQMNNDEMETSYDSLKRQNEAEQEISKDPLEETTDIENKSFQDAEVVKSKPESTNDTKKRKRGRPRIRDRIVSNSSATSAHGELEVSENEIATSNFEESKIKDQKLISHTKEHLDEASKSAHINPNIHPPKRSRGRPRKNPVQNATNLSIQAEDSSASESMKSKCNEVVKEETGQIESEKAASTTLVNSSESNDEFFLASKNHIRESQLSETEKDELKVDEENEIPFIKVNTSDDQLMQEVESTNIKIADIFTRNCDTLAFNIPSEKNEVVDTSEINENADDGKVTSEDKSDNDTSANISNNSTAESLTECSSQITEKVSIIIDDLKSIESIRTNKLESCEIQQPSNISEEKQTKSGKEHPEVEIFQKETKLESQSENSEDEVTDDKSLLITTPSELLAQKTIDDLDIDSSPDKRTSRTESSSKRLFSGSSQSAGKERETGRKKSKASRGKRKKTTVAKITELSSDSENEFDGIESASSSKSKIVKSVFGRVFGGEKADKVKEVLNDWVSRSEDDSDISRSASEARSCLRGPTKISENGHKKDKKRHSSSDTKKDAELSPRKKGSDKSNNLEVHGKLKNRRKREKDLNTTLEDPVESPINPVKRRHRESKIRADERILRTFDSSESLILWENDEDVNKIKEMSSQFDEDCLSKKDDELGRYHEEEWKEERTKDRNPISTDWENLRVDHDVYGKSKNSSNRKKQDAHAKNERSSSPSQFNMFKCRQRESKIKAGERIWKAFDNETSACLFDQDLNEIRKNFKEQESEFHESGDLDRLNNSKSVKHKDDDTWKDSSFINQEQIEAQNARGKSKKDSNNRKKQNFNTTDKTKTDDMISKNSDNSDDSPIALRNQKTKDEMQNDQTTRSTSESRNRSKNLTVKDNTYESFADINHQSTNSRKSKKGIASEDWKLSMKNLEFDQEDLAKDDQPMEKEKLRQKHEVSAILSHSNLAGLVVKDQFADLDVNSQAIRESDNDDEEEEQEDNDDDDDDDDDLGRRRMSPFYACETPRDSSIDSSSNNEEDEDEDGDEEERMTHEDTSRKNSSEFSGEKIVIRSPSSGHRSDVVTIAPTDAIEDNALDVPREIESMTEPRQGKILNFDEELFVECCSRLKATSENELRGAKKIKLDHTESYHRRDDQPQGFRVNRDRWRDVESQNSLGSLLESVNQLLGEEMCNSYDKSYRTRGSEQSSRSASPDASRVDNLSYEDSLDVAFQHNNKLRDKIQQRMRESENLIASTFGSQKTDDNDYPDDDKRGSVRNSSYSSSIHEQEQLSTSIASNRERVPSPGHKNKVNSTLGGLVDKALSNLLHSNSKHDHNGSAPMKLLAELACARAPTSTSPEDTTNSGKNHQSVKMVAATVAAATATKDTSDLSKKPTKGSTVVKTSQTKKTRNPIKELFERKKEINDRKDQERSKATQESNVQKPRKPKRGKKQQQQQEFPLIRRNELYGGLMEKKKRRDSFDRKGDSDRIKDVYEFDEEESQIAPPLGSVMSYRSQVDKSYDSNWLKKDIDEDLGALENGKTNYIADTKLDAIIDRKFQELEKFAPKTKGALKSFQSEEQQQQQQVADPIIGPMDDFVERKQQRLKRLEQSVKQPSKLKKRGKSPKKRARNAWYENDSSDEFRTAAKAEDVGVGISKSQRACSKGKQNLFAELSTSSESEYEREEDADYVIANEQQPPSSKSRKSLKKQLDVDTDEINCDQHVINESKFENEDQIVNCDWENQVAQKNAVKKDYEVAKSESEMSDRSLVIDERKTIDEARNSDDDADNQYERTFELEDLYREDSSETETEVEGNEEPTLMVEEAKDRVEMQALDDENVTLQMKTSNMKDDYAPENELIPLEEALDFLDRHEDLEPKSETVRLKVQTENDSVNDDIIDIVNEASNDGIVNVDKENKHLDHTETQDEKEEPDDDVPALPEKLSSNEKPQKESDNNLPLHVFLSRKVQESKKRKQQQLDKLREEQERILMDFQPTRRQRKCAIGKQGLLAEISSSDEESYARDNSKRGNDHDKSRKKRESKEKRKERYLEKKHEQMFAKEQKAIEEQILREVGKRNKIVVQSTDVDTEETKVVSGQIHKKKYQSKEKQKKSSDENIEKTAQHISSTNQSPLGSSEDIHSNLKSVFPSTESTIENNGHLSMSSKRKKLLKSPVRLKKVPKLGENGKIPASKKTKESSEKSKKTSASNNKDSKERRSSGGKHDSDDEELKTTKSWNKVEEGVGVAIGRRKRTAVLQQLYYWSSSSDEEEAPEPVLVPEEEEDDRQEQHGWIVGDSHKRMITMLAMEKQQKEKRRRSEDEFESGKTKSKKHRNSTS
ncbi:titin homolog isoform X2 [Nylanderia fulva]|uniref:titin homolog isoform X2 n=1 Tax=Nylanderia fulva TaxID=613905 RepID=UPI0010FBB0E4|nr:titin homolog isoform X2 [Nylanderia fulva]